MNQPLESPLARLLADATRDRELIAEIPTPPSDAAVAYSVQQQVIRLRQSPVGGWKVGSKSSTGPIHGAPLPASGVLPSGSTVSRADWPPAGLELEVAFRLNRSFEPREEEYSDEEVLGSIGEMAATIEIVASRFATWPKIDPLLALADLQNHGVLVVGEFVPYRADFNFYEPSVILTLAGEDIVPGDGANPAGDPRRLLPWLVNTYRALGQTLTPDIVITTGTYTGLHVAKTAGEVAGEIKGLPPVSLQLVD